MSKDGGVELRHPGSFSEDPLTAVLRSGAQRLLAQAVEMEVEAFIAAHADLEDDAGRRRVVRHGHHQLLKPGSPSVFLISLRSRPTWQFYPRPKV